MNRENSRKRDGSTDYCEETPHTIKKTKMMESTEQNSSEEPEHDKNSSFRNGVIQKSVFQQILKERKQERKNLAERKRRDGLQRIMERRLQSQIGLHPLYILPAELWHIIIQKTNSEGKGNLCEVHTFFDSILSPTKTRDILLPRIMNMKILNEFHKDQFILTQDDRIIRSISKTLRDVVNQFHENLLMDILHLKENAEDFSGTHLRIDICEGNSRVWELEHLMEIYLKDPPKNWSTSFLFRSILVSIDSTSLIGYPDTLIQFKRKFTTFLNTFGKDIWQFTYICEMSDGWEISGMSVAEQYKCLQEWLALMPNLKSLDVNFNYLGFVFNTELENLEEVREAIKAHVPPKLEKLERFDFCCKNTKKEEMLLMHEAILNSNRHVKVLQLCGYYMDSTSGEMSLLSPELMNSVQSLDLEAMSVVDNVQLDSLEPFLNFNWKLNTLILNLDLIRGVSINRVFRLLEKFPTLERLNLSILNLEISEDEEISFLQLGNLKEFQFQIHFDSEGSPILKWNENVRHLFSLHFLLYCPNLQTIRWDATQLSRNGPESKRILENMKRNSEESIDFSGGWTDLRNSNIWTIFPHLEHVMLKIFDEVEGHRGDYVKFYHQRDLIYHRFVCFDAFDCYHNDKNFKGNLLCYNE